MAKKNFSIPKSHIKTKSDDFLAAFRVLKNYLNNKHSNFLYPYDIAEKLRVIFAEDEKIFISLLKQFDDDILGEIILNFQDSFLEVILNKFPTDKLVYVLESLPSDDATDLLQLFEVIDEKKAGIILDDLTKEDRNKIIKLKKYSSKQAGAYMQTELFKANYTEKINDAIIRLKEYKKNVRADHTTKVFIVGYTGRLLFSIPLEDLIVFDFDKSFKDILISDTNKYRPIFAYDTDRIKNASKKVKEYDLSDIPIVDSQGVLLGKITSDDIYDIIGQEATKEIYKFAGLSFEAEKAGHISATKQRGIWLFVNLFSSFIITHIISFFQPSIAKYAALAILMPVAASMGGNVGTQTLAIMVRRLALEDISFLGIRSLFKRILFKEIVIGSLNGLVFGGLMAVVVFIWFNEIILGALIFIAMLLNFICAVCWGAIIPFVLYKFKIDPATGSSVFLTMLTDMGGYFFFLGLATVALHFNLL